MSVVFKCQQCGKKLRAADSAIGRHVRCPCGAKMAVPREDSGSASDASGLEALADGAAFGAVCPACQASIDGVAVLCTHCGFNLRTGRHIATSISESPPEASYLAPPAVQGARSALATGVKGRSAPDNSGFRWSLLIKIVLALLIVGGGVHWGRQLVAWDPKKIGDENLKKLSPGMTLQQVVDILGPPQEVFRHATGEGLDEQYVSGQAVKAQYSATFLKDYDGRIPTGFYFVYRLSMAGNHHIFFDEAGKMQYVEEVPNLLRR